MIKFELTSLQMLLMLIFGIMLSIWHFSIEYKHGSKLWTYVPVFFCGAFFVGVVLLLKKVVF